MINIFHYLLVDWECFFIFYFLSRVVANRSDQATDQDLLSHILRSLASQTGEQGGKNISGILKEAPNSLNAGNSLGNSELVSTLFTNGPHDPSRTFKDHHPVPAPEMPQQGLRVDEARGGDIQTASSSKPSILSSPPVYSEVRDSTARQIKMNNFDLNDIYIDSDDGMEDIDRLPDPTNMGTSSLDSHQSSPPQTSGHSDSVSAQSPASSSGDAQVHLYSKTCIKKYKPSLCLLPTLNMQYCYGGQEWRASF